MGENKDNKTIAIGTKHTGHDTSVHFSSLLYSHHSEITELTSSCENQAQFSGNRGITVGRSSLWNMLCISKLCISKHAVYFQVTFLFSNVAGVRKCLPACLPACLPLIFIPVFSPTPCQVQAFAYFSDVLRSTKSPQWFPYSLVLVLVL